MYIKSIIIEGFKSYAQRTEINDFDPLFNAITGLNGSGKSNILDSICFLLGITNLNNVSIEYAGRSCCFCTSELTNLCGGVSWEGALYYLSTVQSVTTKANYRF